MLMTHFAGTCSVGGTVAPLRKEPGRNMNIFPDLSFHYDGYIREWRYYANRAGSFVATVWRSSGNGSYTLVAKDNVTASGEGIAVKMKECTCFKVCMYSSDELFCTSLSCSLSLSLSQCLPYDELFCTSLSYSISTYISLSLSRSGKCTVSYFQNYMVSPGDTPVQRGDFIGIHYTRSHSGQSGTGVVPYESADARLINKETGEEELELGSTWTFSLEPFGKIPALVAITHTYHGI